MNLLQLLTDLRYRDSGISHSNERSPLHNAADERCKDDFVNTLSDILNKKILSGELQGKQICCSSRIFRGKVHSQMA